MGPHGAQGPQEGGRKLVVGANPISVGANSISVAANPVSVVANPKIKKPKSICLRGFWKISYPRLDSP